MESVTIVRSDSIQMWDVTRLLIYYEILYANNVQNQTGSVSADPEFEFWHINTFLNENLSAPLK